MKSDKKKEVIDQIVGKEWAMFDQVNNIGGRAECQDNYDTFYIMRYAQHSVYDMDFLSSYLKDLQRANTEQRNMVTNKYAYMMEKTHPVYFELKLKPNLPEIDEKKKKVIKECITLLNDFQEDFFNSNNHYLQISRPKEDSESGVSSLSYYEGELKTYSYQTLVALKGNLLRNKLKQVNPVENIYSIQQKLKTRPLE